MPEQYQKVGRGGAGNYMSQSQIEQARGASDNDLEAQRITTNPATTSVSNYARTGRGGSGNFHDPATLPVVEPKSEETKTVQPTSRTYAYSGRGGAGNWGTAAAAPGIQSTPAPEEVEALERQVVQDVEAGLAMPPRAHTQQTRVVKEDDSNK
ncbi:hypothetical protein SODALDRAFT_328073 [Sodiomyces alkalinus F11]|uniref:Uncharacterized protein n=1 Tax=Sodiomyces alkalinus (strain CBS 110278 / VKM F-3762 / F11) TaxID=1314773 RepID=A0A3N2PMC8_SODAK|nr:hypothetical protein SODALDRAFT_328073 [Sodiomyces alkalinus F11]ROT35691.1 hypothetical protein SODALDRAFT_328073 [Sodiomyces alkalinus F11]